MRTTLIVYVVVALMALAGWVQGFYKLTQCDFEPSYKAECLYRIGVVTGFNSILGWFDFGK